MTIGPGGLAQGYLYLQGSQEGWTCPGHGRRGKLQGVSERGLEEDWRRPWKAGTLGSPDGQLQGSALESHGCHGSCRLLCSELGHWHPLPWLTLVEATFWGVNDLSALGVALITLTALQS